MNDTLAHKRKKDVEGGDVCMYKYNDYLRITREYLRNYIQHQQAVKTLTDDIEDLRKELSDTAGKTTASYSAQAGGAYQELTGTERMADTRMNLRVRIAELYAYRHDVIEHLERMDQAIRSLELEEKKMVELFFYERKSYKEISESINLSERSCQRRVGSIVQQVAKVVFGELANKEIKFAHG